MLGLESILSKVSLKHILIFWSDHPPVHMAEYPFILLLP